MLKELLLLQLLLAVKHLLLVLVQLLLHHE